MSDQSQPGHRMSRRQFASRLGLAAGVLATGPRLQALTAGPAVGTRIPGANDRVVVAVVGIRSQGNALKRQFARLENVEVKTLCDVDTNLAAGRVDDPQLADVPRYRPGFEQDMRRMLEDADVDAVVIASPNHWHALHTIWSLQAGKHVYVEKPSSHTVWEGEQMVAAARRYSRLVQVGLMNRSRPAVIDAIRFLHEGGLGRVFMARGLCFKPRPSIGRYPDGPLAPGERYALTVTSTDWEPVWDAAYLAGVDYDLWTGPAPLRPFNRNRFHYNWHWHWDYGNGDSGNQGPHQFDIARWGLRKDEYPVKVTSTGGYFGAQPSSQETPDTQTSLYEYADGVVLEFATRGGFTNSEGERRIGNLFYGEKGWLWIEESGRRWQSYLGPKDEPGPGTEGPEAARAPSPRPGAQIEHVQNFVDAIRAGDASRLSCDITEGHLSSALPLIGNIACRLGRQLRLDPATGRFLDDEEANAMRTRSYRAGFEVPAMV